MIIQIRDGSENDMNNNGEDVIYAPISDDSQQQDTSIEDELNEIEGIPQPTSLGDMMATGVVEMGAGDVPPMMNGTPQTSVSANMDDTKDPFANDDEFTDAEVVIESATVEPIPETTEKTPSEGASNPSSDDADDESVPTIPLEDYKKLDDRYNKLMADWDNYRKRSANEVQAAKANANKNLIETLIPTLDNFRLAATHVETQGMDPAAKGTIDGFIAIYRAVMTALEREGLSVIAPEPGTAFDMNEHQAVGKQPDTGMTPDTVASVVQVGYKFNGTVIRPAMVNVAV